MGRITGYNSPEGTVSYTYDANGNVLTVTDSHGIITRTYDALNRVSSYTDTYGKVIDNPFENYLREITCKFYQYMLYLQFPKYV